MATDSIQAEYNSFLKFPDIPYNVTSYLINNNEMIFKLLKYADADAWSKSNLTLAEKRALIYKGSADMSDYRIFFDNSIDDTWMVEACMLRISPIELLPSNYVCGHVSVGLEVYCHSKVNHLSNYTVRVDTMIQQLLQTLNGADITDVGRLFFDKRASARCKVGIIGTLPYKGKALILVNHSLG